VPAKPEPESRSAAEKISKVVADKSGFAPLKRKAP